MKVLNIIIISILSLSCAKIEDNSDTTNSSSFLLNGQWIASSCFPFSEFSSSNDTWVKHVLEFNSEGYLSTNDIAFDNNFCEGEPKLSRKTDYWPFFKYWLGEVLSESENILEQEILFKNQNTTIDPKISVVQVTDNDKLCFANGTIAQTGSNIKISMLYELDDNYEYDIDLENCFKKSNDILSNE